MVFKLILKTALIGSLTSLPIALDFSNGEVKKTKNLAIPNIDNKINDIEIFEKIRGCKFVFSAKQEEEGYEARKWLEKNKKLTKEKRNQLIELLISSADYEDICEKGKYLDVSDPRFFP